MLLKFVPGEPLSSKNSLAAKEVGKYLALLRQAGAAPPFSGGQYDWQEFISWWFGVEINQIRKLGIFEAKTVQMIEKKFQDTIPLLVSRPVVLLHGDLKAEHVLIDQKNDTSQRFSILLTHSLEIRY